MASSWQASGTPRFAIATRIDDWSNTTTMKSHMDHERAHDGDNLNFLDEPRVRSPSWWAGESRGDRKNRQGRHHQPHEQEEQMHSYRSRFFRPYKDRKLSEEFEERRYEDISDDAYTSRSPVGDDTVKCGRRTNQQNEAGQKHEATFPEVCDYKINHTSSYVPLKHRPDSVFEHTPRHTVVSRNIPEMSGYPDFAAGTNESTDGDSCCSGDRKIAATTTVHSSLKEDHTDYPCMIDTDRSSSNFSSTVWEEDDSSQGYCKGGGSFLLCGETSGDRNHCRAVTTKPGSFQKDPDSQYVSNPHAAIGAVCERTIEIQPGHWARLRGAEETWRAIKCDFYAPCECICCNKTIFCIQDAKYVLCPDCRVISLLQEDARDSMPSLDEKNLPEGGVGLGFTMEELAEWQEQIIRER